MSKKIICQVGPGKGYPGGMKSVIDKILSCDELSCFDQKRIVTASKKHKFLTFFIGSSYFLMLCILHRVALAHIHMSERGSCIRTQIIIKICTFFKIPVIVHSHGGEIESYYNSLDDKKKEAFCDSMRKAKKILVLTPGHVVFWKAIVPQSLIYVLPNSVKCPVGYQKEYFADDRMNVLFLGYISEGKGIYELVGAIEMIKKEGNDKIFLRIGGNGEIQKLTDLVNKKNLNDVVEVCGWMDEERKNAAFEKSDLLVLPSHFESFGIVVIEAMAHKLPVICGDKGYTKEIVTDGKDGLVIESGNITDIKNKIEFFIDNSDAVEKFGSYGYEKVAESYCDEIVLKKLKEVYSSVVSF